MIDTVLFDMGGTLEDIFVDEESTENAIREVLRILREKGALRPEMDDPVTARERVLAGWDRYAAYRSPTQRELKPEEIWGDYVLRDFGISRETAAPFAEERAHMWEVTYYHRSLRPRVPELLDSLRAMGMKLGVISNTASLFQVFDTLCQYGIRDYFQDVTLSSITGYHKPHPNIFRASLYEMQSDPADCAYVGDTFSRDVIGPQNMGFGATFYIHSHLSDSRDVGVPKDVRPTFTVEDIYDVSTRLRELRQSGRSSTKLA